MKRVLVFWFGLLALLAPARARASTPYTIHWVNVHDPLSCGNAQLSHDGDGFFHVNGTLVPTFQVPGAYAEHADGSSSNIAEAPFDVRVYINETGGNDLSFGIDNPRRAFLVNSADFNDTVAVDSD